jgi:dTDP-4-amino-4,6-dideoxygalactose transaminase
VPCVVPVDLLGTCVDHAALTEVAGLHGVRLLTDAAESLGSSRDGRPSASLGEAAVLSFNGNKVMTTSGGGMLVTDDADLAGHVRKLSTQAREPANHYEHTEIGYNYRLSNILAALGRAQLSRLEAMIERRREWRRRYADLVADIPGVRVLGDPHARTTPGSRHWSSTPTPHPSRPAACTRSSPRQEWRLGRCGSRCTSNRSSQPSRALSTVRLTGSSSAGSRCRPGPG